jgi:CheY-like chemotaxis protein
MRVLVADDDDDLRALVVGSLREDGYEVSEAADGVELLTRLEEALDESAPHQPDVVLADVRMPRLSGLGVLEALRRARLSFPVVLMTVIKDDSVHLLARRLGAVGVIHKPLDMDDLRTALVNARSVFVKMRGPADVS